MQLQAGYLFDFIRKKFAEEKNAAELFSLVESLCYFETDLSEIPFVSNNPELAVLNNLISKNQSCLTNLILIFFFSFYL